jgi:mono/diheme cytochrome c family protein
MDDLAKIQAGARAFALRGCASCHGGPGVTWAKFSEGLRPDPPVVTRNGINMTGMPGFNLIEVPDEEIWTIAAFVKNLPSVSEADYKTWDAGAAGEARPSK